jgi:hypothetical protein
MCIQLRNRSASAKRAHHVANSRYVLLVALSTFRRFPPSEIRGCTTFGESLRRILGIHIRILHQITRHFSTKNPRRAQQILPIRLDRAAQAGSIIGVFSSRDVKLAQTLN